MSAQKQHHPVFLHSGWRTAGTWIWSQFRGQNRVMGFYEPFSESLGTLTLQSMLAMRPGSTNSRHPEPDRPYFEEFTPLFRGRRPGVTGYQPEFAYGSFFLEADAYQPELAGYVNSLLRLAYAQGKIPVLKFCRSLGRAAWLRTNFPNVAHVVVVRDPISQWLSGWRIFNEDGNPYYVITPLSTLMRHRHRATVAHAIQALRLRPEDYDFPQKHGACCVFVRNMAPESLYRGFLAFWVAATTAAVREADAIIESERLGSPEYRVIVEQTIENLSGITVDLAGARPLLRTMPANVPFDLDRVHKDTLQALSVLGAPQLLHDKLAPVPVLPVNAYA